MVEVMRFDFGFCEMMESFGRWRLLKVGVSESCRGLESDPRCQGPLEEKCDRHPRVRDTYLYELQ